jgi:hypothetical protein
LPLGRTYRVDQFDVAWVGEGPLGRVEREPADGVDLVVGLEPALSTSIVQ